MFLRFGLGSQEGTGCFLPYLPTISLMLMHPTEQSPMGRTFISALQLGLSIDEDAEAEDDDLPPLEADVAGQDEGSRMEDVD